jgi:hypothetical protein
MAQTETNCVVLLSTGKSIETSQTVEDVQSQLSTGWHALKNITDANGQPHWLNIAHVVSLHHRGARSAYFN